MSDLERQAGYLRVARKLFDGGDLFWPVPFRDRFSRGEAWLDVIQMAAYRDGAVVNGIRLKRGEFCGSLTWLARRWGWSIKAVRWFLSTCERSSKIVARLRARSRARTPSVYLLANYDLYNPSGDERGTDSGIVRGTVRARLGHNDEESKKGRSTDMAPPAPTDPAFTPLASQATPPAGDGKRNHAEAAPVEPLWAVYLEELGGNPPHPRLTDKRRQVITALHREHLRQADDPCAAFREILARVKASEWHMGKREYQMPESLFRSEERRDRWAGGHVGGQEHVDDLPPALRDEPVLFGPGDELP